MADRTFLQSYVVSGASAYRSFRLIESAYEPTSCQSDRREPPLPMGLSRLWSGPAAYPSSEIARLCTRSLGISISFTRVANSNGPVNRVKHPGSVDSLVFYITLGHGAREADRGNSVVAP